MKREIITTADGSKTIQLPEWNEQYHSVHGAIAEALHVFIESGLQHWSSENPNKSIDILEIGFGTGLNAFLSLLVAKENKFHLVYSGIEAYPILDSEISHLNYAELLKASQTHFLALHQCKWEQLCKISKNFSLTKRKQLISEFADVDAFDVIYFDAFGPRVQPELWEEAIFAKMYTALRQGGVIVTYSAKGSVRRAMQAVGFLVERLPGPPGKREMLRATKPAV